MRFARARLIARDHGVHLVDWICCDDDAFRSLRMALDPAGSVCGTCRCEGSVAIRMLTEGSTQAIDHRADAAVMSRLVCRLPRSQVNLSQLTPRGYLG